MPLPATAGKEEAARYYEAAVMRLEKGEAEAAIIELKNALRQDPDLLAARALLGKAYVEQGDGAAAEKELLLADRLGADRSLTVGPLAKAYLQQYKYQELLERIQAGTFPPLLRAELLVHRGHAHVELRQFDKAEQAFDEAGRLAPESALPVAGQALASLRRGELDEAGRQIEKALGRARDNAEIWNIKASVEHAKGDLQAAIAGYDKVVALKPKHLDARIARAAALMDMGRDAESLSDLQRLREEFPYEPRAAYLQSVLLARNNEPQKSKAALEETAGVIEQLTPDMLEKRPQLLFLAGLANYSLGQHEKARGFLGRYIGQFPMQPGPRKLLGSIHLSEGNPDQAIEVLEPALQVAPNDYRLLSLLAAAQMRKGRHEQATALLERAVALSAGAPEIRTGLALSHLGAGQQALALEELASVFARDSDQTTAGIALGALYLKRGEFENAEGVAQTLTEREPDNVTALNLLGTVQAAAKKRSEARTSFEKALARSPGFLPAHINLAKLDVVEGKPEAATKRLGAILEKDANNIRVMIELAKVEQARNNPDEAARWLEKARELDRNVLAVRLHLAEHYLNTGKAKAAAEVAQEAELIAPENLEVLAVSGRAQFALGKAAIAKVIFKRMSGLAQNDYQWLYRIAGYQLAANAMDDGIWSLQKAVNENREFLPARVALVEAQLRAGRMENAYENAQGVRSDYPKRAVGYRLLGDVYAQRGDYAKAIASYEAALAREPDTFLAVRLYQTHRRAGNIKEAIRLLEKWASAHPDDHIAKDALAEGYLRGGRPDEARRLYEELLKVWPDRPGLLNNLANIYSKRGDPARALALAEKAHGLAPENAAVNDTLGWVLVRQGRAEEGLRHLRDAHFRASSHPEIRYHIAAALSQLGRKEEAKAELEQALRPGQHFDGIEDARALQRELESTSH